MRVEEKLEVGAAWAAPRAAAAQALHPFAHPISPQQDQRPFVPIPLHSLRAAPPPRHQVKCGDKEGKLFNSVVTCICDACCEEREEAGGGGTFSLNAFEHHAGRGNRKKWKDSIRVKETGG